MKLAEVKKVSKRLISEGSIDFLDISLWDVWKQPEEKKHQGSRLLAHFTKLDRKNVKLTVAGNIRSANDVTKVLEEGVDFVSVGRSGILHHNFPELVLNDAGFTPIKTPVSLEHLQKEGLSSSFINYMKRWENFVKVKS
jgi:2,4-dienoyl-CoA reductase-like NADH-dependent reductase (Old Yellow Enzyme family)